MERLDLTKVWVNFRSSVVLRFSTKVLNALLLVESQNELWGFGFRAPYKERPNQQSAEVKKNCRQFAKSAGIC